jgi:dipeptidyl aminopeptidase/acylaminoacyl peptidase
MLPAAVALVVHAMLGAAAPVAHAAPSERAVDELPAMRVAIDAARARIGAQAAEYHDPVGPRTWIDGARLWYAESARDGARRWWLVDASQTGDAARVPLFDHAAAAAALAGAGREAAPDRLPVRGVAVEPARGGAPARVAVALDGLDAPLVFALGGGRLADDPAARALLETSLKPGKRRSRGQGASTHLVFENRLDEAVEILWVDRAMNERSYGVIEAGGSRRQQTFGGHAWLVRTVEGRELGHVVAGEVERTVAIGDAPPAEPEAVDAMDGQNETQGGEADSEASGGVGAGRAEPPALRVEQDGPNLVVAREGAEIFRTTDGAAGDGYRAHWISPRQDAVFALKVKEGQRRAVHLVESAPRDQLQPKLRTLDYTKPGDAIERAAPRLFRVAQVGSGPAGTAMREVALDDALFANPWSIDRVRVLPNGREIAFLYNERGHRTVRLVAVDLETGAARTIAEESFPTFVDYTNKIWMHWLDETGELLWMTERSGWNHIVLVDVATGKVKCAVTEGPWLVRRVHAVDEEARTVDIALMGRDAAQDPYHIHHARVSIDDGRITMLTDGDGTCRVDFSPTREALVSVRARADMPPVYEVRRASDGALVAELGHADDGAMRAKGWRAPKRFHAKGRDGATDIWGLAYFPSDFDATKPYPIIENIYAGPHGQHVPKWFELGGRSREYAELGAVVVQIDGMGTNWRSKAFHDVAAKNLADAGFPDRIAWIRALAAAQPGLDLARVGIFGGSAGGQNAMRAVLDHADFYKAAVADCGCHDNRMDKIWWNEQWMGWPVDESYARSSNTEDAARLGGALMLVVGALDDNVDPSSTMQVVQKLIDAGKDFELLVVPDGGHGIAESDYGNLRRARFLFRELARGDGERRTPS